jgi:molybdopterin-containing oxidoreductase family membrane subunit
MLATGLLVAYGYFSETFFSWYSGSEYDQYMMANRLAGPYWPAYWTLLSCNIFIPQVLWLRRVRRNMAALFIVSLVVNVGMWLERYVIVVTSLHRDYLPSSWGIYHGTIWDWATLLGTIGFFFACMFLFIRVLPMISMHEMREIIDHRRPPAEETP